MWEFATPATRQRHFKVAQNSFQHLDFDGLL